jgi:hypothetical protein
MARIWVKALALGFDGMQRRKDGEKFQVGEKAFSPKWMKKIKTPEPETDPDDLEEDGELTTLAAVAKGKELDPITGKAKNGKKADPERASDESKI